jgi:glycosyltransferase involved in cell wall biosynthesis
MNYLVLGTVLDDSAFSYDLAANPASTKWLSGFVGGLLENGDDVSLCGHCYARAWPRGPLFPGKEEYLNHNFDNNLVRFINLPGIRFRSMASGYYRSACSAAQKAKPDVIVTYNPYPWHAAAARRLRDKLNIPWICLNLDFDDVGGGWEHFLRDAGDADGHLFLSHWGYENAPVQHKIHLDSGVCELAEDFGSRDQSETVNVVYLGKLSKSGGLDVLLALPQLIAAENVRFIYGGKGYPEDISRLNALAASDSRVDFRGFVEDSDVAELFECADVFINPRDPDDVVNDMVFPSKIMHYLQTGKTVVSTWTKGLDPVYRDLMLVAKTPTIQDFVSATIEAVEETTGQRIIRSERIADFLRGSRLWPDQAQRFDVFVFNICKEFEAPVSR